MGLQWSQNPPLHGKSQTGGSLQCSKVSEAEGWGPCGSDEPSLGTRRAHTDYSLLCSAPTNLTSNLESEESAEVKLSHSFLSSHCSDWVNIWVISFGSLILGLYPFGRSNSRGAQLWLQQRCMSSAVGQQWIHRTRMTSAFSYTHFPAPWHRQPGTVTVEWVILGLYPFE